MGPFQARWGQLAVLQAQLVAAAAASGWKQTHRVGSLKTESAAGTPAGWAAPLQHTLLSEMPERERTRGCQVGNCCCYRRLKATKGFIS